MINSKQSTEKNTTTPTRVVSKVSITETLRAICPGTTVTFKCKEFASAANVQNAICRLNKAAGEKEYHIDVRNNGESFAISRKSR